MEEKPQDMTGLKETRLAVVFSGGVSLAVYESGVALEFYRLVKGEGVYGELKKATGPVVVDVITGTSAGGMNGVFLANALVNRGDMRKLIPLWLEEGDFDKLLYGPFRKAPMALLDGDLFLRKIHEALCEKRADASQQTALQPSLDLFITGTNLEGSREKIGNIGDREEETMTHRQVFHFRYRRGRRGEDGAVNDFEGGDNIGRLAVSARASASFPGAFEPVLVKKSQFGVIAKHLEADAYHIDGGVLDNKPLELALKAIDERSADKKVDRVLFFVDPDPKKPPVRSPGEEPEQCSPFEVVLKAVTSIPMYQSLTSAFEDIVRYNLEIDDLKRTTRYYEDLAGNYRQRKHPDSFGKETPLEARTKAKQWYVYPKDAATALYRAIEDGYLDLRLGRDLSPKVLACFSDGREGIEDLLAAERAREREKKPPESISEKPKTLEEAICRAKRKILVVYDLNYPLRLCRYLIAQIRELYPEPASGTSGRDSLFSQETAALNSIKQTIGELQGRLEQVVESQRETRQAEIDRLVNHLVLIRERIKDAGEAHRGEEAMASFETLREELDRREELLENGLLFEELFEVIFLKLRNEFEALRKDFSEFPAFEFKKVMLGYWKLRDTLECFYQRDIILYPQTISRQHARELQTICYERISPDRAESFIPGLTSRDKLAGDMLAHFSGFLSERWRGNDLVWGRLDAAEIIIRRLMPRPEQAEERNRLISTAQAEILEEMNRMGLRISDSENQRDARNLIGKEGLDSLPGDKKVEWSLRSAVTFLKIVKQSMAESRLAFLLKKVLTGLNFITGGLAYLALLVNLLCRRTVLKIVIITLIVLALMGISFFLGARWHRHLRVYTQWVNVATVACPAHKGPA
jgi:patatin-related protein